MGFFDKILGGLKKTKTTVQLDGLFADFTKADDDFYDELEECLILADVGVETTTKAVEELRKRVKSGHLKTNVEVKEALMDILTGILTAGDLAMKLDKAACAGIEDNLDPGCVHVFELAKKYAWEIKQMAKAELAGHIAKGKY